MYSNNVKVDVDEEYWSPSRALHTILERPQMYPKDYTYIVLGKIGPTGKTWLTNALIDNGYKAFDLTESLYKLIDYPEDTIDNNWFSVNHTQKFIVIILHRRIK